MALTRSLSTGASSLRAHQQRFDVISNNIANSNTTGYKSSRVLFSEQLKQNYSLGHAPTLVDGKGAGGVNPLQFGLGVKVASVSMNMGQGALEQTGRPLDLAIQGEGFFAYNMNGIDYYSRAGAITIDKDGSLVDSMTGAHLKGHSIQMNNGKVVRDSSGANQLKTSVENLGIDSSLTSPPKQTTSIKMSGNLNSSGTGNTRETSITIHDQRGVAHTLALTFTRNATNTNQYDISAKIDGNDVTLANAAVTFKPDGTLDTTAALSLDIPSSALNTALGANNDSFDTTAPNDKVNIVFGDADNLLSGLTHYSGSNTAIMSEQDGFSEGSLTDVSVDGGGRIIGAYSNGESMVLGQVTIAKFANPAGLTRTQGNYFSNSVNSGEAVYGAAGEEFPSTSIASASLESSNVDMTEQFTDMITTQRAYEAAARTITVSDQMLSETNMLKR